MPACISIDTWWWTLSRNHVSLLSSLQSFGVFVMLDGYFFFRNSLSYYVQVFCRGICTVAAFEPKIYIYMCTLYSTVQYSSPPKYMNTRTIQYSHYPYVLTITLAAAIRFYITWMSGAWFYLTDWLAGWLNFACMMNLNAADLNQGACQGEASPAFPNQMSVSEGVKEWVDEWVVMFQFRSVLSSSRFQVDAGYNEQSPVPRRLSVILTRRGIAFGWLRQLCRHNTWTNNVWIFPQNYCVM